jgi:hypothetical protein
MTCHRNPGPKHDIPKVAHFKAANNTWSCLQWYDIHTKFNADPSIVSKFMGINVWTWTWHSLHLPRQESNWTFSKQNSYRPLRKTEYANAGEQRFSILDCFSLRIAQTTGAISLQSLPCHVHGLYLAASVGNHASVVSQFLTPLKIVSPHKQLPNLIPRIT